MRPPSTVLRATAVLAAFLGLASCERKAPSPDVLLVTIDTLRPDRVGVYGHPGVRTPHLDALARGGVQFRRARVPYPLTLPSHASILTGRLPYAHGARRNDSYDFDDEVVTLASLLEDDGYETGAVVSTFVLNSSFGLARGFATYVDFDSTFDESSATRGVERRADEVADLAIEWLDARQSGPFFLWAHFFDPHDLYTPPPPFDTIYADDLYGGEVAYTDGHLGRVLERLKEVGRFDETLIVLTSDHGEALGEHGETGHGFFLYATTIRVPLLLRGPGFGTPGSVRDVDARSVDVLPTLCDALGHATPDSLDGISLLGDVPEGLPLYVETFEPSYVYGATELRGVVMDQWKLIDAPRPELYDLEEDPHEIEDLYATFPEVVDDLREILDDHLTRDEGMGLSPDNQETVDEETRRRLASLGYMGGADQRDESEDWERRDPKDIVHLIPLLHEGMGLCRAGDWTRGVALLERVLAEDPVNGRALYWVSRSKTIAGDAPGAIAVYDRALQLQPTNPSFLNTVGLLQLKAGQPQLAVENLEAATRIYPEMVAAHLNLARAYMGLGRPKLARESIRRAYEIDPQNPMVVEAARAVRLNLGESDRPGG